MYLPTFTDSDLRLHNENTNTVFYKFDVENLSNSQICRILAYLIAEKSRQEFRKFFGYLKFPHHSIKMVFMNFESKFLR